MTDTAHQLEDLHEITVTVNGRSGRHTVEGRTLLVHFLREAVGLTGTHVGCDTGNCGACTVRLDGRLVKSCMVLAAQADGRDVRTVEGLAGESEPLAELQQSFHQHHALQCGYCTPGMLMAGEFLLERNPNPTEHEIRRALKGNICRCTGYQNIVRAIHSASDTVES